MSTHSTSGNAAIVGAAHTDRIGKLPEHSRLSIHAEAARNALADAGLSLKEVDGIFSAVATPNEISEYLNITPRYVDGTSVGGCSYIMMVGHAVAAIMAGLCDVALIIHGESGKSWIDMAPMGTPQDPGGQFEDPFGTVGAASTYALPVLRHFHEYGTTKHQMSHIPAASREWALLNPMAMMHTKGAITPEDVMASRPICYPLNLLDCCLVCDGGGALVITSMQRARDMRPDPIAILGTGEATAHRSVGMMRDFTTSDSTVISGRQAFAHAGLGPEDIDHVMLYDAFSPTPMYFLEDLGFVPKGEVGPWLAETSEAPDGRTIYKTGPGGALPMNTNGGGLSFGHSGRYGMFAMLEAVFQLRGQAGARQLDKVETSLVHGPGRQFAAASTVILGRV